MPTPPNPLLEYVIHAKACYRRAALAHTWEERVAAIERMRAADKLMKEGMRKTLLDLAAGRAKNASKTPHAV